MTIAANEVGLLVEELMPLLEELWDMVPETGGSPATGTMSHHKAASSAPWNPDAGPQLYSIAQEARKLEASLRRDASGRLGQRRGGSDDNTTAALRSICKLAYGVPEQGARRAARIISGWIRAARQVIDPEERPKPLPVRPGKRRPPCPYCGTFSLRVAAHTGAIWCMNRDGCKDRDGHLPRGTLQRSDVTGDGMIVWRDGRITQHRDLA